MNKKSENNKALYVVFSSTHCKIGKLIRTATRYEYNHTSISLDEDFKTLYSFARYRKTAPFYAGFVRESSKRYFDGGELAKIKVYKLPISNENYYDLKECLERMEIEREKYVYNLISAMCVPINRRIKANRSFTCVEFCVFMMSKFCDMLDINGNRFWSIKALQEQLSDYLYYEGPFIAAQKCEEWGGDTFLSDEGFYADLVDTIKCNMKLAGRVIVHTLKYGYDPL